jgi:HSP20 family protein
MSRLPAVFAPFGAARRLDRVMDEFFKDFDQSLLMWPTDALGRSDVYEKDGKLFIETELPGVQRNEVKLRIEDGRLYVEGETKRNEKIEQENYVRIGRRYGRFQKIYSLPEQVGNFNEIDAKLSEGILTIAIPLKESVTQKKAVEIRVN